MAHNFHVRYTTRKKNFSSTAKICEKEHKRTILILNTLANPDTELIV